MGYAEFDLTVPVGSGYDELRAAIRRTVKTETFTFDILLKSLDARKKNRIVWSYRVGVNSPALGGAAPAPAPRLEHDQVGKGRRIVVVGTGPAGLFSALYLARSGFKVTVLERGGRVEARKEAIDAFEAGGAFSAANNYCFGEGGAGTFSDGKLSSRTKGINAERNYVYDAFISAGAPDEIRYMTHPHLGSDLLFGMTARLRGLLLEAGCELVYDTRFLSLAEYGSGTVRSIHTDAGDLDTHAFVLAVGHSAYETHRSLISSGVPYRVKNFALGFRAEHAQEIINHAQWGVPALPGVKAAEYRLTAQAGQTGVYTFCMCPGGTVVQASAYGDASVVNGKSDYSRDGMYANAAVVAGVDLARLTGRDMRAEDALDWLEDLERRFKDTSCWKVPAMTVRDFLNGRSGSPLEKTSYAHGLAPADLAELLPAGLVAPLREGLSSFCSKLRGFDTGTIMGLESKTSAPIQVERDAGTLCSGYDNLYLAGEGSGWSGGIVSSAADGLRVAQAICGRS